MTPSQIVERASREADTRLDEIVECLLSILDRQQAISDIRNGAPSLVSKWEQSGLLDGLDAFFKIDLAKALEAETWRIVDWVTLDEPDDKTLQEVSRKAFYKLRDEALRLQESCRRSVRHCYCDILNGKLCDNCKG